MEEFKKNIVLGNFLEYTNYNDNYYGTLKNFVLNNISNGYNVIAVLESQGALNIKKNFPSTITIFIIPPSFKELERRLRGRNTDSEEIIRKRLDSAKEEIRNKDKYDYVIVNASLDKTLNEIEDIIDKSNENM